MWPKTIYQKPLPPKKKNNKIKKLPGKPKVKRTKDKSAFEGTGKKTHTISRAKGLQKCSTCRGIGHKKSSFPGKGKNEFI